MPSRALHTCHHLHAFSPRHSCAHLNIIPSPRFSCALLNTILSPRPSQYHTLSTPFVRSSQSHTLSTPFVRSFQCAVCPACAIGPCTRATACTPSSTPALPSRSESSTLVPTHGSYTQFAPTLYCSRVRSSHATLQSCALFHWRVPTVCGWVHRHRPHRRDSAFRRQRSGLWLPAALPRSQRRLTWHTRWGGGSLLRQPTVLCGLAAHGGDPDADALDRAA
jgi:hypothetical protein